MTNFIESLAEKMTAIFTQQPIVDQISFLRKDLMLDLNKAVLHGEYRSSDAIQKLTQIETILSKAKALSVTKEPTIEDNEFLEILEQQRGNLLSLIQLAQDVKSNVDLLLNGEDGLLIDTQKLQNYEFRQRVHESLGWLPANSSDERVIFEINILLAYIDERLECSSKIIEQLNSIITFIKPIRKSSSNTQDEILKILQDKAEYLHFKIIYRECHTEQQAEILKKQIPNFNAYSDNAFFLFFKNIDRHHNPNETDEEKWSTDLKAGISQKSVKINLLEIYHLNRLNNKSNNSIKQKRAKILELQKKAKIKRNSIATASKLDQIALLSIDNLLFNSLLNLDLQSHSKSGYKEIIEEVVKLARKSSPSSKLNKIVEISQSISMFSTGRKLPDYYIYKRHCEFIRGILKHLNNDPEVIFNESNISGCDIREVKKRSSEIINFLVEEYNFSLSKMKSALRKMTTYSIKPLYVTEDECMLPYKWKDTGDSTTFFVNSSSILPNNFDLLNKDVESLEAFITIYPEKVKSTFDLTISQLEIKTNIAGFEKRVKENEFKVVQIVAMFVSIASFILLSVKLFDGKSAMESFGIMLGLASCFFVFNIFFYLIILPQTHGWRTLVKFLLKSFLLLLAPLSLAYLSYCILITHSVKNNSLKNNGNDSTKTMINTQSNYRDSSSLNAVNWLPNILQ